MKDTTDLFRVISKQSFEDGVTQVIATSIDEYEPQATIIVSYPNGLKVIDQIGDVWRVVIDAVIKED